MPANKNALIRYKTIDKCLRNRSRRWTIEDLMEKCSDALYDCEGIKSGVSLRTVQGDLQMMRSNKLGYNAPIEVYDHKYYRYSDSDYSITDLPLSDNDINIMTVAVNMLRQFEDFSFFNDMADMVSRLQVQLAVASGNKKIVDFERNNNLKGLKYILPLYKYIERCQTIEVNYKSFIAKEPHQYVVSPLLLKEYRNRWFLFCNMNGQVYNFALDRIESVRRVKGVPYEKHPDFNPDTYFKDIIGVTRWGNPVDITFWASNSMAGYIATKPIHPSQQIVSESIGDGSKVFTVFVEPNWEFFSLMLSFGDGVRILSPENIVQKMQEKLEKAIAVYANP